MVTKETYMRKLLSSLIVLAALPCVGFAANGPQTLLNETGLAYSTSPAQNLNAYGSPQGSAAKLSAQITVGSATVASQTFTGGTQSTTSITVVSNNVLAVQASNTITVPSTSSILGTPATNQITISTFSQLPGKTASLALAIISNTVVINSSPSVIINGQYFFTFGTNVTTGTTAANSATNLAAAITAAGIPYTASVVSSTGVLISCVSSGTVCNGQGINSTALTGISSGTLAGGVNAETITIVTPGQTFLFTYGGNWVSTDTAIHAATTLANALSGGSLVTASAASNVVYASATAIGSAGNSFTIATSSVCVTLSSTNFLGGADPILRNSYFSLNGVNYHNGKHWTDVSGTSTGTAASITAFINGVSTSGAVAGGGLGSITASQAGGVITLTQAVAGAAGNNATLTATPSSGGFTIGTPTFISGQSAATLSINGVTITAGVDFSTSTNLSTMAASIVTAITAKTATMGVTASAISVSSTVFSTSTVTGTAANYVLTSSTQAALRLAGPVTITAGAGVGAMTGGTNATYNITTNVISIPSHGFTKALPVLYSGTPAIGGLTTATTYFVVVVDANSIGLSSTSAVALTGSFIDLTSSNTSTTSATYTLAPGPFIQGPFSAKWQVSNDGGNWADYTVTSQNISVSSQTVANFAPVFGNTTIVQDFGFVDYGYIRYNVTGPTQGGAVLKVILNAKD